ncbi:phosphate ABC transporter permease PstA [Salinisphaera sp. LB1]|uniref:phosphate ABC transporter permease PstA n=1 Tax=Salinisphaera sp. LB1 TaxID=2183911 RepID=UPI000D7083DE|nr:phosphate ABC transporter permease PstA [Salinisphaera sp. LB1]
MSETFASTTFALDAKARVRYHRRRLVSYIGWTICGASFLILAAALVDILAEVTVGGFSALNLKLFTEPTQGVSGGLLNAIEGTALLTVGSVAIAGPLGIGVGVYCSEKRHHLFSRVVRFMGDVLVGVPSIVLGLFGYITMVVALGWHFSVLAGAITLAIMIIPYIARTTELALVALPGSLRESAYSLGASEASVILRVLMPSCAGRILTGLLLAMALSMGETAPLIYTVGWSNYTWSGQLTQEPVGYLTYVIWSFINEPFESAHKLAFAAALLITFFALAITLSSRLLLRYIEKGR